MNLIFQSYPSHPWLKEWMLEPRGCSTTFHKNNAGYFFRTTEKAGCIAPNVEGAEWELQIDLPAESRIKLLFNGYCAYHTHRRKVKAIEIIIPEPGVLWGRILDLPMPKLTTQKTVKTIDGFEWLETDTTPVLLACRDTHFCLVSKAHLFENAQQLAESYLDQEIETQLQAECDARKGAAEFTEQLAHHDALGAICIETLQRAIRPPEGSITTRWSQAKETEAPYLNTNDIHPLVLAWSHLDADTAEELFLGALRLQNSAGAIPVVYAPNKTFSILEAPKPLFAKTAEKLWEIHKNSNFIATAAPLLRRHLQWLLHHFDHKRRNFHCWQTRNESFTPSTYETECTTVDLTVLLLTEIDALNRLQDALPEHTDPLFAEERKALENNLNTQFWNDQTSKYDIAIQRSTPIELDGFPALTPLLWHDLPDTQRNLMLDQLHSTTVMPDGSNLLSWRSMVPDGDKFPLLQQLILLEILETRDPIGSITRDFTKLMLLEFMEWHTRSLKEYQSIDLDPAMASFILNLMAAHHFRDYVRRKKTGLLSKVRIHRFDIAIIALALFAIFTTHTIYNLLHQAPPFVVLDEQLNSAYSKGDVQTILESGLGIIKFYPDQSSHAQLIVANTFMLGEQFKEAEPLYEQLRKDYPDSPAPMVSLGLVYHLEGRLDEAKKIYDEFTYLFDEIFPYAVGQINRYKLLINEGLSSPPNWDRIYQNAFMHEL